MNKNNQNITFKGNKVRVVGEPIKEGQTLPHFVVTGTDLNDIDSKQFSGKTTIISVVPSLDTPVCSLQTKRFNKEAEKLPGDSVVLTVSMDLPFAQKRWCASESCTKIVCASDYKHRSFGEAFGAFIQDIGLLARSVFVADKKGKVVHVEYVSEITKEPDYEAALAKAREVA